MFRHLSLYTSVIHDWPDLCLLGTRGIGHTLFFFSVKDICNFSILTNETKATAGFRNIHDHITCISAVVKLIGFHNFLWPRTEKGLKVLIQQSLNRKSNMWENCHDIKSNKCLFLLSATKWEIVSMEFSYFSFTGPCCYPQLAFAA